MAAEDRGKRSGPGGRTRAPGWSVWTQGGAAGSFAHAEFVLCPGYGGRNAETASALAGSGLDL